MTLALVGSDGFMMWQGRRLRVALGKAGVTDGKQEGDQATPAGVLPLRRVLFRADRLPRPPAASCPREALARDDGWCDDPGHPDYNKAIRLPHPARHEALWRDDGLYDVVGVLGWNDRPVVRGRGSAIFLHVAAADFRPTEGCVALPRDELLTLLAQGLGGLDVRPAAIAG